MVKRQVKRTEKKTKKREVAAVGSLVVEKPVGIKPIIEKKQVKKPKKACQTKSYKS